MRTMTAAPDVLRGLLERLTTFKVLTWGASSEVPADGRDREKASIGHSHVVSSLRREDDRHALVLDIDHQAHLVESSTPGHYHLYVDVPGGIEWGKYKNLLGALAECGVIEQGYANVSVARGHSDVRLPWITKGIELK